MKYGLVILVAFFAGCGTLNVEAPQSFPERVAYVEALSQGVIQSLIDLTCRQYTAAGACTEAARPLHPARSQGYLDGIAKARSAARAAATMSAAGGQCLGQPSTPAACLELARVMVVEVQRILADLQKGK